MVFVYNFFSFYKEVRNGEKCSQDNEVWDFKIQFCRKLEILAWTVLVLYRSIKGQKLYVTFRNMFTIRDFFLL